MFPSRDLNKSGFNNWGEGTASGDSHQRVQSQEFLYDPPFPVCPIDNSQSFPTTQSPAFNSLHSNSSSLSFNDTHLTQPTLRSSPEGNDDSCQLGMQLGHQTSVWQVNQSTSLGVTPFPPSNLHQCGGGPSDPFAGSLWGSEHTFVGNWTPASTTQANPAVPITSWCEAPGLPATNAVPVTRKTRKQREPKVKMYQLPEQEDPEDERRRVLAVKEFKKRERVKMEKEDLERVLADTIQENGTMKQEIDKTQKNIEWFNQQMNQM